MTTDATAHFQQTAQKLNQLLKLQEQVLRENERLRRDTAYLQAQLKESQETAKQLQDQLTIAKTAAAAMDEATKKAFEKKINQHLADIDKVIAHLNS